MSMKKSFVFAGIILISVILYGQSERISAFPEIKGKGGKNYTLSGLRHGVNYFPKVRLPQVQYEAGESLTFDRFHSADVVYTWLKRWAEKYPELI